MIYRYITVHEVHTPFLHTYLACRHGGHYRTLYPTLVGTIVSLRGTSLWWCDHQCNGLQLLAIYSLIDYMTGVVHCDHHCNGLQSIVVCSLIDYNTSVVHHCSSVVINVVDYTIL